MPAGPAQSENAINRDRLCFSRLPLLLREWLKQEIMNEKKNRVRMVRWLYRTT
jgi:hypothetical protein